ncbi:MAG: aspartate/glutamate racemase family protein [Spirochaetales bacterium]|nr:aspartate/glutamate racemase family protein [Spirochaetales bacterium]
MLRYCGQKDYGGLVQYFSEEISNLAKVGYDFVAMTGKTPHIVFDNLQSRSPIPLACMLEAACRATQRTGYHSSAC